MKSMPRTQRGAALLISLIMLLMITALVMSALAMSISNVKAISNNQFRDQALAAANAAIEQVISSPFTDDPTAEEIDVDIDKDDTIDFTVAIQQPICAEVIEIPATSTPPSSLSLGEGFTVTTAAYYITTWDLDASVTDVRTQAAVRVHQGVRVKLNQTQFNSVCA